MEEEGPTKKMKNEPNTAIAGEQIQESDEPTLVTKPTPTTKTTRSSPEKVHKKTHNSREPTAMSNIPPEKTIVYGGSQIHKSWEMTPATDLWNPAPTTKNRMEKTIVYEGDLIQTRSDLMPASKNWPHNPPENAITDQSKKLERLSDITPMQNQPKKLPSDINNQEKQKEITKTPPKSLENLTTEVNSENLRRQYFLLAKFAIDSTDYTNAYTFMKNVYLISKKTSIKVLDTEELTLLSFISIAYSLQLIIRWKLAKNIGLKDKEKHFATQLYMRDIADMIKADAGLFIPDLHLLRAKEKLTAQTRAALCTIIAHFAWIVQHVKGKKFTHAEKLFTLAGKCGLKAKHPLMQCLRLAEKAYNLIEAFPPEQARSIMNEELKQVEKEILCWKKA